MKTGLLTMLMLGGMAWATTATAQLYTDASPFANPFRKPPRPQLQVGQLVHIKIVEDNHAHEKTETRNDAKSTLTATFTSLFGEKAGKWLFGSTSGGAIDYPDVGFQGQDKYDGKGESKLQGSLEASISGVVKRVLPSGNALIEARRTMVVGNDRKNISITGVIRPEDVDKDNTITSDKVADAQITYHGEGPINDQTYPGLMNRIFDYIPLF